MAEFTAQDIMSKDIITVTPDTPVKEAAKIMSEKGVGGLPVIDKEKLVGLVTERDLIMQDVRLHFPTYLHFLDGYIYLESLKEFERKLRQAVGANVGDVMTRDVITVGPDDSVEEVATLLVEKGISRVPVMEGDVLLGIVTKSDIVKSLGESK